MYVPYWFKHLEFKPVKENMTYYLHAPSVHCMESTREVYCGVYPLSFMFNMSFKFLSVFFLIWIYDIHLRKKRLLCKGNYSQINQIHSRLLGKSLHSFLALLGSRNVIEVSVRTLFCRFITSISLGLTLNSSAICSQYHTRLKFIKIIEPPPPNSWSSSSRRLQYNVYICTSEGKWCSLLFFTCCG